MRNINYIVIHHTASTHSTFDSVIKWHMEGNGWDRERSGYHYMISKEGVLYESNPVSRQVWHCKGSNHNSVGVCLVGNFDVEPVSGGQLAALKLLLSDLKEEYPGVVIEAHRNMPGASTYCPGYNLLQLMGELK